MSATLKISYVALVVCWTTRWSEISYDAFKMFQNEFGKSVLQIVSTAVKCTADHISIVV